MSALACAVVQHREPRRRAVLHVLRQRTGARCPSCATPAPAAARFCMNCGAALDGQPAHAPVAPRRRSAPARGAAPGHGAVRRPLGLHGGGRADGPGGREGPRGPGPDAPRRRGGALRRQRGQVHRGQRDGALRRARRPRGRRGARRPRGARHAGGDGRGQRRPPARGGLPAAGGHQHRRGDGGSGGRELHGDRRHRERGIAAPERRPPRERHGGRADDARHPRGGPLRGARAARAEGQGRAGARLGGAEPDGRAQPLAGRARAASPRSWAATTSS